MGRCSRAGSRWCRCCPCASPRRSTSSTSAGWPSSATSGWRTARSGWGRWPGTPMCWPTRRRPPPSRCWPRRCGSSPTRPSATGARRSAASCTPTRPGRERLVPAAEFFLGPLESAVEPGELATEALFPVLPPGAGTGFAEVSRRRGDYAVCGVAATVRLDTGGRITQARAAYLSVGPAPLVLDLTGAAAPGAADGFYAAADLARQRIDPEPDIHATADYRRHLAGVLTQRALQEALGEAQVRGAAGTNSAGRPGPGRPGPGGTAPEGPGRDSTGGDGP